METQSLWVLGAPDPEMEEIEALLRNAGERYAYALVDGERVRPEKAYRGTAHRYAVDCGPPGEAENWFLVECQVPTPDCARVVHLDHHRPGDPGFGRPPAEFLAASSIGQVVAGLARLALLPQSWDRLPWMVPEQAAPGVFTAPGTPPGTDDPDWWVGICGAIARVPVDLVLAAAADHCLGAAYDGQCPGVDPDALMLWRAASRAKFQNRAVEDVLADIEATTTALRAAPRLPLGEGVEVADMRREPPYPELPEAATRLGIGYIAGPLVGPDGRRKYTCSGEPEQVSEFMSWARTEGLKDTYGDPARGFAGAYEVAGRAP